VLALFVMLLTSHIYVAAVSRLPSHLLVLVAWHVHEPEQPA
jgi:hypothetical protein